jgi:hypothetical protein
MSVRNRLSRPAPSIIRSVRRAGHKGIHENLPLGVDAGEFHRPRGDQFGSTDLIGPPSPEDSRDDAQSVRDPVGRHLPMRDGLRPSWAELALDFAGPGEGRFGPGGEARVADGEVADPAGQADGERAEVGDGGETFLGEVEAGPGVVEA